MTTQRQIIDVKERRLVIELPESFVNQQVELILRTLDDPQPPTRRAPDAAIAGKGRTIGDLVTPIVEEGDWECLK